MNKAMNVVEALKALAAIEMPSDLKAFCEVYLEEYFAAKGALEERLEAQFSRPELRELRKVLNQMLADDDYDPDASTWPVLLFRV